MSNRDNGEKVKARKRRGGDLKGERRKGGCGGRQRRRSHPHRAGVAVRADDDGHR